MTQRYKDALSILAIFIWIIGSSLGGIFLHIVSARHWMDGVILVLILVWAGVIGYFYNRIIHSS